MKEASIKPQNFIKMNANQFKHSFNDNSFNDLDNRRICPIVVQCSAQETNKKPQNFTRMTADEFANKVDGIINDLIAGDTTKTQFKHSIQDLLQEVVYKNEDLKAHYFKQYEQEAKAVEFQSLVCH